MRFPIRYQFMLPLVTVAVVSLVALALFYSRFTERQTTRRIETQLQGVVEVLINSSYPLTDTVLKQMAGLAGAEFILTDRQGNQLAGSRLLRGVDLSSNVRTAEGADEVVLGPEVVIDGTRFLHSSVWLRRAVQREQDHVLHILFASEGFQEAWRAAFLPPMLIGLVTVLAVATVTHLAAGRVSRTLARLGRDVQRLAEGNFRPLEQPNWNDETRDLAAAMNQTAERLSAYEDQLRQSERTRTVAMLGAGLAHEMRNAATGCRLAVDLHAEGCHAEHPDDSLEVARRQLTLMESRLQQLLQLGKEKEPVAERALNLAELVSASVALVQPAARHAGVRIDWTRPAENATVIANADLLGQAVMNLLLNSLDAATKSQACGRQDSFVRVEVHCRAEESELVVSDSGDGPGENLSADAVFEPFVTTKSEGVGLGLTMTKRVVESLGGHIGWQRSGDVTKFRVRLPLAAAGANDG